MPNSENGLWFYSGLVMLLISIFFIEPYYTSPKNVITNTIPLLLVILAIEGSFENKIFFWCGVIFLFSLLFASIISISIRDENKSTEHRRNKASDFLKDAAVLFGQGRLLYSIAFLYFLLSYYSMQNIKILLLFFVWFIIISIDPKKINSTFFFRRNKEYDKNTIGEIFAVESKNVFLVKVFDDRENINKFDLVDFKYSMQDTGGTISLGIITDVYFLNKEKWTKVLKLKNYSQKKHNLEKNIVYKVVDEKEEIDVNNLVGVIIEGSNVGRIKFEYFENQNNLQEGDLLELKVQEKRLFYQVTNGVVENEKLKDRNEAGFIVGEATQLGEWDNENVSFKKFGWVPSINTPVFIADTSDIETNPYEYPNYTLGKIPGTELPSVINLNDAVSHHMALLGVTGSGKSFLAREIIEQIKNDTKVICVDFNREFVTELSPSPDSIIEKAEEIAKDIDWINKELEKFPNQQNKGCISTRQERIKNTIKEQIEIFLDDADCNIKVFELPDVSNTTGILDYTKYFFKVLFEVAKERQLVKNSFDKICVVLEEAHTIIPEWNFSGSGDKVSQSLVNSIGQIALQGRKYGVGFLVIAQRTANVSKTVLTQCNTVVCFQAFDETSFTFLGNYIGKDLVQTLPNLKSFHAIVTGKAAKSNLPMIIDLTRDKKKE